MWTETWPTEPGEYWFYGWCFWNRDEPPKLHFVRAYRSGDGGIAFVAEGHFAYSAEEGYGMWQPVDLPEPPELGNG